MRWAWIAIIYSTMLVGCGGGTSEDRPDRSTPAKRVLGAWEILSRSGAPVLTLEVGAVDPRTLKGRFALVEPDGSVVEHAYRVLNEELTTHELHIEHLTGDGRGKDESFQLPPPGQEGWYLRNFMGEEVRQRMRWLGGGRTRRHPVRL